MWATHVLQRQPRAPNSNNDSTRVNVVSGSAGENVNVTIPIGIPPSMPPDHNERGMNHNKDINNNNNNINGNGMTSGPTLNPPLTPREYVNGAVWLPDQKYVAKGLLHRTSHT